MPDWDWFWDYGIWIVVTLVVTAVILLVLKRWSPRWISALITRITPAGEDWSRAARIINRALLWIGILLAVGALTLIGLPSAGVDISSTLEDLGDTGIDFSRWLRDHGVVILIIIIISIVVQRILGGIIPHIVDRVVIEKGKRARTVRDREELEQRSDTLGHFLGGVANALIWIIAIFMILPEMGVEIGPLLAGVGIVGLAIAFGAQNLIRDIFSGLFIIMEDQYGRGDVVTVAGIIGTVESVNIRRTELRDLEGVVHVIPNGEIKTSSNYTKDWSRIKLDVPVAYGEDLDQVIQVMNKVGHELYEDPAWRPFLITPPQVLRVNNFGDSGIDIRILGETKPARQWAIGGELRLRLKKAFDSEGIEIPWPHTKLYLGDKAALDLLARYSGEQPIILDHVGEDAEEGDDQLSENQRGVRKKRSRRRVRPEDTSRDLPDQS